MDEETKISICLIGSRRDQTRPGQIGLALFPSSHLFLHHYGRPTGSGPSLEQVGLDQEKEKKKKTKRGEGNDMISLSTDITMKE